MRASLWYQFCSCQPGGSEHCKAVCQVAAGLVRPCYKNIFCSIPWPSTQSGLVPQIHSTQGARSPDEAPRAEQDLWTKSPCSLLSLGYITKPKSATHKVRGILPQGTSCIIPIPFHGHSKDNISHLDSKKTNFHPKQNAGGVLGKQLT